MTVIPRSATRPTTALIASALGGLALVLLGLWIARSELAAAPVPEPTAAGKEAAPAPLPPFEPAAIQTVRFVPGAGLVQGRIIDREGCGVAGVTLKAIPGTILDENIPATLETALPPRHLAASQADGHFRLDPPDGETFHLAARVGNEGWLIATSLPAETRTLLFRHVGAGGTERRRHDGGCLGEDGVRYPIDYRPRARLPKPPSTREKLFPTLPR